MSDFQNELKTLLPEIMGSPRLYPHTLDMDKGAGLIIDADREFYKNAVFLDQRVLTGDTRGAWVPLEILWRYADEGKGEKIAPANFIFHVGHAGSTLISRLLDELPSVLGLREPLPLRTMAAGYPLKDGLPKGAFEEAFKRTYAFLTRRFSPDQQVVIKATSMCNNLAPLLLGLNPANRALGLFVTLEVFLANMLDKDEVLDIEGFLAFRLAALKKRTPDMELNESNLSLTEKIGLSWLSEAAELAEFAKGEEKLKVLLMDFEQFLNQKDIHLGMIINHFGLTGGDEAIGRILASPVMGSYAKQPGFEFTAENRAAILKESRKDNKTEIEKGRAFIEGLLKSHRVLAGIPEKLPLS